MRTLFAFAGGNGHFEPQVPLARAAAQAGHEVAFAARPAMIAAVEAAGFRGLATREPVRAIERLPLEPFDAAKEDKVLRYGFAGAAARRRAGDVGEAIESWRPALVVCDELDFGAMIAAEKLGLPHVTVMVNAAGSFVRREVVVPELDRLRGEHGLPPDPELAMPGRDLVLSPFPPSLRDPAFPLPRGSLHYRTASQSTEPFDAPWLARDPVRPLVYFTLGTVFNVESGDLFSRVLAGLAELPIDVIATVGREIDPAELGPQPAHVHVERYVPQYGLLPRCAAVVSHAGSGSVLGALAHGLPSLLLPIGADQPSTAARCAELGVARVLEPITATSGELRDAVAALLDDAPMSRAAARLAAEIAAMPAPEEVVARLEQLFR